MPDYIQLIITEFWTTVAKMSPYLLLGFFVAGLLSVFISARLVREHLGGRGIWPIIKAAIFGIPLPLCSCGVIPVSISLRKQGASKAATIAFLLSTPQTGVDSILVTLSLLGPIFMLFRPIVALITGTVGGLMIGLFDTDKEELPNIVQQTETPSEKQKSRLTRIFNHGFVTLPEDIGIAMLIGLAVAALISAFVPNDYFAGKLIGTGFIAMLIMMLLGIPVYVCATASVPIAAALIVKGLSPGAVLVFLMTGPATNAATFATIWKVLGRKTALLYIITVVVCALGAGAALDVMFPNLTIQVQQHFHKTQTSIIEHISAIILLLVLAFGIYKKLSKSTQT
ncbi:MAG: permease [Planctomycetes bacterium]|nr:permease [Planctomycetota bacterium]